MNLYNWIGGHPLAAQGGEWIPNINPATLSQISLIPRSQKIDVEQAVEAAQKAQKEWKNVGFQERAAILDAIADRIAERLEDFAQAESQDTGKPLQVAKNVDIPRAIANFRFFAGAIRHDQTGCHMMDQALNYTVRKPIGTVGLITPWNLPLYLLSWKTAPALAMGNCVVAKPSELTPTTATMMAEIISELAPKGVFNLVHGYGAEAGDAIVSSPKIQALSFTGGTQTGRIVARTAAPLFKKISLELGGKNSSIVFSDCDFEKTVKGVARAAFLNQGQICLCGSRIFVQKEVYERFVNALREEVASIVVGDPSTSSFGSLISREHREKVERYIDLAKKEGGEILCGGARPKLEEPWSQGAWLLPTLITGLSPSSAPSCEEIFGPVAVIHPFENEEDVIEKANSVPYGLSASVWTQDITRGHRVAAAMDTGMVWVNTWLMRDLRVPFGGVKDSGVGREGGRYSLEFFSSSQNICVFLGDSC